MGRSRGGESGVCFHCQAVATFHARHQIYNFGRQRGRRARRSRGLRCASRGQQAWGSSAAIPFFVSSHWGGRGVSVGGSQALRRLSSGRRSSPRSEEHTSELQSPCNLVCRLLLETKKKRHFT